MAEPKPDPELVFICAHLIGLVFMAGMGYVLGAGFNRIAISIEGPSVIPQLFEPWVGSYICAAVGALMAVPPAITRYLFRDDHEW